MVHQTPALLQYWWSRDEGMLMVQWWINTDWSFNMQALILLLLSFVFCKWLWCHWPCMVQQLSFVSMRTHNMYDYYDVIKLCLATVDGLMAPITFWVIYTTVSGRCTCMLLSVDTMMFALSWHHKNNWRQLCHSQVMKDYAVFTTARDRGIPPTYD